MTTTEHHRVVIVASMRAKDGKRGDPEPTLESTRAEDGSIGCNLDHSVEDDSLFGFHEISARPHRLGAHTHVAHLQKAMGALPVVHGGLTPQQLRRIG